ncbi:MAG: mannitol dehydrogenase family protein [Lachnospiraceae bacterium]
MLRCRQADKDLPYRIPVITNIATGTKIGGRSRTGHNECHRIGSLTELLWGKINAADIIHKIASPAIKIISLTITEGGYNLDIDSGQFDLANEAVQHDLTSPQRPETVFGYVAQGLKKRMLDGVGPLTILSCDNLKDNGKVCRKAFLSFFEHTDQALYDWALENISFPSSMVDRITPATGPEDVQRLNQMNGTKDSAPVFCEDFIQWVIEDDFIAGRPAWERVGVEFTDDVAGYEAVKFGFVNSTHQMLSFPAYLAGFRKVDEAVGNETIETYLKQYMELDVMPYLTAPDQVDLNVYRTTFEQRLKNKAVSDQLERLCFDAIHKTPIYMWPTMNAMIAAGADMVRVAMFVASYRLYLRRGADDKGTPYIVRDPGLTEHDRELIASDAPTDFLGLSCFTGVELRASESFMKWYPAYCREIAEKGVLAVLEQSVAEP